MKTSKELLAKAEELADKVKNKQNDLTDALLEGKDTSKLMGELLALQNEHKQTQAAAEVAGRREAEEVERKRQAQLAEYTKRAEEMWAKANDQEHKILVAALELYKMLMAREVLVQEVNSLIGSHSLKVVPSLGNLEEPLMGVLARAFQEINGIFETRNLYGGDIFSKRHAASFLEACTPKNPLADMVASLHHPEKQKVVSRQMPPDEDLL